MTAALRRLIEDFGKHSEIKYELHLPDIDNLFSRDAQIIVYRIFQEALTNIGKHAQASRVTVTVEKQGDSIGFLVADNGKGFVMEQGQSGSLSEQSLGLVAMDERARMLGGLFQIDTQINKGTRVKIHIPTDERGDQR